MFYRPSQQPPDGTGSTQARRWEVGKFFLFASAGKQNPVKNRAKR
jgi:hypothetical protein